MKKIITNISVLLVLFTFQILPQNKIFIPMDLTQTDHLKAYGITFHALEDGLKADWLLNYRGGSFLIDQSEKVISECLLEEVYFEQISLSQASQIYAEVQSEDNNMDVVRLEKAPKIAVYVPPGFAPWDDAVTLALEYANVKYDKIWNDEILRGDLE
ncbi:MAG TPA: asparagine synthetase B, partial [Ignavibacteriaceae bacterium]|nr:asparagine synthetase B [Ignavibacteriaceae bacterium]